MQNQAVVEKYVAVEFNQVSLSHLIQAVLWFVHPISGFPHNFLKLNVSTDFIRMSPLFKVMLMFQ